jgi:hypothetical protein
MEEAIWRKLRALNFFGAESALFGPPLFDVFVMAVEKNIGDLVSAELAWASVLWIFERTVIERERIEPSALLIA